MMDIVERLRNYTCDCGLDNPKHLTWQAANEIEWLRKILLWVIELPEDSRIHAKVARKAFALKEEK